MAASNIPDTAGIKTRKRRKIQEIAKCMRFMQTQKKIK